MKPHYWILPLLGCWFCALPGRAPADGDTLPLPRILDYGEAPKYSAADFQRLLLELKSERESLHSDWNAMLKRRAQAAPKGESEHEQLQMRLKEVLRRLEKHGPEPREIDLKGDKNIEPPGKKRPEEPPAVKHDSLPPGAVSDGPLDALARALALFRSRQYDEALASFHLVDVKGKKPEVRAPVQYLKALCLVHLGQDKEAMALLTEVSGSRGDEKIAAYARWELDELAWQKGMQDRLRETRQRRQALEKKP